MDATPEEHWRPIVGWEGLYEVSSLGRMKSVRSQRLLRLSTHTVAGYHLVGLSGNGLKVTKHVHRLVLDAFVGPLPPGMVSCHTNGNPDDNRLANLRYDTPHANNLDKVRHGRDHNARKTHCKRGHEFTPENTIRDNPHNPHYRKCRECSRKNSRDYMRSKRAARRQTN